MIINPRVSVLMSVLNGEKYLDEAIASILKQSLSDLEFLITDDGSEDNSLGIIKNWQEKDKRIKIFMNDAPIGLPSNLNKMASQAKGDFLARMDADDVSDYSRFDLQISLMNKDPDVDVCFTKANLIDEEGNIICEKKSPNSSSKILSWLPYVNFFVHPTAFIRKSSFEKIGGYDEEFLLAQDWELWQRMNSRKMKFFILNKTLLDYRTHIESNSKLLSKPILNNKFFFKAKILIFNGEKLKSMYLFPKINILAWPTLIIRLLLPLPIFYQLIKIRTKIYGEAIQNKLWEQKSNKKNYFKKKKI